MMKKTVAIVHYNTPELTEAAVLSIRRHGGGDYRVVIFDNSDKRPWTKEMPGVEVIDNTQGQVIDFDKELEKYPERDASVGCSHGCNFGSDKHMMTVQWLWDYLPEGFMLMDPDVLIKRPIDELFDERECAVGQFGICSGEERRERLMPYLLWINVPMCKAGGARFFDPDRSFALHSGAVNPKNHWDTGASFLDDIRRLKPQCHGRRVTIQDYCHHLGSASWYRNDAEGHASWLMGHGYLWEGEGDGDVTAWVKQTLGSAKYTVITYIFGGYEKVREVEVVDPNAEYILVTDDERLTSRTWRVICDKQLEGLSVMDKCYEVRFHPWRYASNDVVIRVDGSMVVTDTMHDIVKQFNNGGYDMALMMHPDRMTLKDEYDVWVQYRHYPQAQADRCMSILKRLGYKCDKTRGLYEGGFMVMRRCKVVDDALRMTFALMKMMGSDDAIERIDQTVFSAVMNMLFTDVKVWALSEEIISNSRFIRWCQHGSDRAVNMPPPRVQAYLFNKKVAPDVPDTITRRRTDGNGGAGKPETMI